MRVLKEILNNANKDGDVKLPQLGINGSEATPGQNKNNLPGSIDTNVPREVYPSPVEPKHDDPEKPLIPNEPKTLPGTYNPHHLKPWESTPPQLVPDHQPSHGR